MLEIDATIIPHVQMGKLKQRTGFKYYNTSHTDDKSQSQDLNQTRAAEFDLNCYAILLPQCHFNYTDYKQQVLQDG